MVIRCWSREEGVTAVIGGVVPRRGMLLALRRRPIHRRFPSISIFRCCRDSLFEESLREGGIVASGRLRLLRVCRGSFHKVPRDEAVLIPLSLFSFTVRDAAC